MSNALQEFEAEIEAKRKRAEKCGSTYELSEEERKKLRVLKFGEEALQRARELNAPRKRKGRNEAGVSKKTTSSKKEKKVRGSNKVSQLNLDDPDVQKRLEKFGPPPEGSQLKRMLEASEEKSKIQKRKEKFQSSTAS